MSGHHRRRVAPYAPPVRWAELLLLVVAVLTAVYWRDAFPGRWQLRSRQETQRILQRLGIRWQHPGPPVVVLDWNTDRYSGLLVESLTSAGMPYVWVDAKDTPEAEQVLAEISKDRWGRPRPPRLPVVIVGTRVIHDDDDVSLLQAYRRQANWRAPE